MGATPVGLLSIYLVFKLNIIPVVTHITTGIFKLNQKIDFQNEIFLVEAVGVFEIK